MGIEPTRDLIEPHTGFEDLERHQAAGHLPTDKAPATDDGSLTGAVSRAGKSWPLVIRNSQFSPTLSLEYQQLCFS
jgi:hypothetical protein